MTLIAQDRKLRAPAPFASDQPYFDAAAEGRLVVRECTACKRLHHYPRSQCPFCISTELGWKQVAGTGVVYTCSVTRRGVEVPFCIAYVTLDEGVTMMTNIVDCDLDAVRIGQRVKVVFKPAEDGTEVPMFTPV